MKLTRRKSGLMEAMMRKLAQDEPEAPAEAPAEAPIDANPNAEILAEAEPLSFLARKNKGCKAKKLEQDMTIDTLEGEVSAKAGDWLCKGVAGEPWPQKEEKLFATYDQTSAPDAEGWVEFSPKPDSEAVQAAQIDHPFQVIASWGTLAGKAGDYVVHRPGDTTDVWIVDKGLFEATYGEA